MLYTFVLVHGAWAGGWSWKWVAESLRADGHRVLTPTLTGLGERVHLANPQVDLDTHITDIVNVLNYEDLTDLVLVGWSAGGTIATGVADRVPERIRALLFLDANIPRDGESCVPAYRHQWYEEYAGEHGDGWKVPCFPLQTIDDPVFDTVPREWRKWILDRMVPQPTKSRLQPLQLTGAGTRIPTTFIRCTVGYDPADPMTQIEDARIQSEPDWNYLELAGTHLAPFSVPEAVAQILVRAAGAS